MGEQQPQPHAGWYPDPSGVPGHQRYFDGTNWGPPAPPPTPGASPYQASGPYGTVDTSERRFTIHYGFALLAVFSLLGTLLFGIPMLSTGSDPDSEGFGVAVGVLWMLWGLMWTVIWTAFAIQHTLRGRKR